MNFFMKMKIILTWSEINLYNLQQVKQIANSEGVAKVKDIFNCEFVGYLAWRHATTHQSHGKIVRFGIPKLSNTLQGLTSKSKDVWLHHSKYCVMTISFQETTKYDLIYKRDTLVLPVQ